MNIKKKKTLLIISGGIEAKPGILLAKQMGFYTVVCDGNTKAPGLLLADDQIISSTYDVKQTLEAAVKYNNNVRKINGVMSIASDVPLTVASIAHELNLPSIPLNTAKLAIDKLSMKEKFLAESIPIPWFVEVKSPQDLNMFINKMKPPLIIKPVDSRGARGVQLIKSELVNNDLLFNNALQHSPSKRVMLERFLAGPQLSTESLVVNTVSHTIGFSDRNYEFIDKFHPFVIENGGSLPSHLNNTILGKVDKLLQKSAEALNITNGVIKGDIVIHKEEPFVIELATRLSGGYFCSHEIPENTGVDFLKQAIKLTMGETIKEIDLKVKKNIPVAQRYWFPKNGKVKEILGLDNYKNHKDIILLEIRVKVGDEIKEINSHPGRAGVVITRGKSINEAILLAEEVIENIKIITN